MQWVFTIDLGLLVILLAGATWSVVIPGKRIWPPPARRSWQYLLSWLCFYVVFGLNLLLIMFDWDSGSLRGEVRFSLGIPLVLLGTVLLLWGIRTLGGRNTSGIADGLVREGPYRFTRNPQYLGDMLIFIGLSLLANSFYVWIVHLLLILVFIVIPLAEEPWMEEQYGEGYRIFKSEVPRFL